MNAQNPSQAVVAPVRHQVIVNTPVEQAFTVFTDGSECDWGQVLVWEPPARLVLAWQVDGTWSYEPEVEHASRVTVTFTPDGDRSQVTLVHDEFERHRNAGPALADGVRDGWGSSLRMFAAVAETVPSETAASEPRLPRPGRPPSSTWSPITACRTSLRWRSCIFPRIMRGWSSSTSAAT